MRRCHRCGRRCCGACMLRSIALDRVTIWVVGVCESFFADGMQFFQYGLLGGSDLIVREVVRPADCKRRGLLWACSVLHCCDAFPLNIICRTVDLRYEERRWQREAYCRRRRGITIDSRLFRKRSCWRLGECIGNDARSWWRRDQERYVRPACEPIRCRRRKSEEPQYSTLWERVEMEMCRGVEVGVNWLITSWKIRLKGAAERDRQSPTPAGLTSRRLFLCASLPHAHDTSCRWRRKSVKSLHTHTSKPEVESRRPSADELEEATNYRGNDSEQIF